MKLCKVEGNRTIKKKRFTTDVSKIMNEVDKLELIKTSWELHGQVETSYINNPARPGDDQWLEKQRFLLADMALHLLQTSINPDEIKLDRLRDNIHSILTISDQFLPKAGLKQATAQLYEDSDTSFTDE